MRLLRASPLLFALTFSLAACAISSPPPTRSAPPSSPAPATASIPSASSASPSSSSSAIDACAGPTDCATCTARPGCRFCTASPRGCLSMSAVESGGCGALALGHPFSCSNDPVDVEAVRRREVEEQRQAVLDTARGMNPSSTIDVLLERFSPLEIAVPAGSCHALLWTLAPGAKPGDVSISLEFVTARTSNGGLTGFSPTTRVGTTGVFCSSTAGKERFRLVDRWSRGPVKAGGTGMLSFVLYTRPRTATDPDASIPTMMAPGGPGGSVGVDCQDCTFPCESSKTSCERDCFRGGLNDTERRICERTCEQLLRACLRGCPGCD